MALSDRIEPFNSTDSANRGDNLYGTGYQAGLHAAEMILADAVSTTAARQRIERLLALADVLQDADRRGYFL
jgi:hypothetical protein